MKRLVIVCAGLLLVLGAVSTSHAGFGMFQTVKIGGGVLWNDKVAAPLNATGGGIHVSFDFGLARSFAFTPFYEYSRRNSITSTLVGGEFHYTHGSFYFGPGFGIANAGGQTKFHINGVGGYKFNLSHRFGLFVQGKYAWAADDLLNGVTFHGGFTFPLMSK